MIDCGMFCRGCGGFYVFFRRLRCLFAVKCSAEMAKMRCKNGKNMVRKRRNMVRKRWLGFAISVEIHCVTAVVVFAFGGFQP